MWQCGTGQRVRGTESREGAVLLVGESLTRSEWCGLPTIDLPAEVLPSLDPPIFETLKIYLKIKWVERTSCIVVL